MTINVRSVATLGVGFGPLAVATLGFISPTAEEEVSRSPGRAVYIPIPATRILARAVATEREIARAAATIVLPASAFDAAMEAARARGAVTVDRKRVAKIDDDLLWL